MTQFGFLGPHVFIGKPEASLDEARLRAANINVVVECITQAPLRGQVNVPPGINKVVMPVYQDPLLSIGRFGLAVGLAQHMRCGLSQTDQPDRC